MATNHKRRALRQVSVLSTAIVSTLLMSIAGVMAQSPGGDTVAFKDAGFVNVVRESCGLSETQTLDQTRMAKLSQLVGRGATNITGFEYLTNLENIRWFEGKFADLDLSHCPKLTQFRCYDCRMTRLDFSRTPDLNYLGCYRTPVTSLNVSGCTNLRYLAITPPSSATNDPMDPNRISALDLSSNGRLTRLNLYRTLVPDLDLSRNSALKYLYCTKNPRLSLLRMPASADLLELDCRANRLITLDIPNTPNLHSVRCGQNQLMKLNASQSPALRRLYCDDNSLTVLNLAGNPALTYLTCNDNRLTTLDIRRNPNLLGVSCNGNRLTALDISGNCNLAYLDARNNPLKTLIVGWTPATNVPPNLVLLVDGEPTLRNP